MSDDAVAMADGRDDDVFAGAPAKELARALVERMSRAGKFVSVAESLTGGLLGATIVAVPGASNCFKGGVISYTNEVKASVLGVDRQRLADVGPVDGQVAEQMAIGSARLLGADYAIATTGVAGPGPADGHEAGTVWIGVCSPEVARAELFHFEGDREQVRQASVIAGIRFMLQFMGE